ncbi:hypothetical protein ELQ90_10175 [Labedella phragmitis]|uniref:Uncharacterized protein n=1 Tax=Labedella phragmitis TaxID=2498849 RepID=A0A444PTG4_9MICO|nr:hypothetical protein [Labedella phragmitis]RWZ51142.1 hypothetical protein ELQ90_10175 [Labedella phragmitis]
MSLTVTPYGERKFGSGRARPRIREVYDSTSGWRDSSEPGMRLDASTARQLLRRGFTAVRVRWRLRTVEIILRRYLGE